MGMFVVHKKPLVLPRDMFPLPLVEAGGRRHEQITETFASFYRIALGDVCGVQCSFGQSFECRVHNGKVIVLDGHSRRRALNYHGSLTL
jgi:hypothetical protein